MIPWGVIVFAVVVDLATPREVSSAPLLAVAPVAAAPFMRARSIVVVGLAAMVVHAGLVALDGTFGWRLGIARQLTLVCVIVLAVLLRRTIERHEAAAGRAQRVAEIAQRALLPDPPEDIAGLRIATHYAPADEEILVGGDFYAVRASAGSVRALVGDVRGKGLAAVQAANVIVGAFNALADDASDLAEVAERLDRQLQREGERRGGLEQSEGFTAAVLVELDAGRHRVRVLNRGLPAPLVLAPDGTVRELTPSQEAPPLGLLALGRFDASTDTFPLPPGSTLICCTDGLTEARNARGQFYDAVARLPRLLTRHGAHLAEDPGLLLSALAADAERHAGGRHADDQGMLAIYSPPAPVVVR
ncbi:PP2C family protein-serine/threonine phosphatase [Streptomyces sp. B1I3]|uniref:PP2C family protein-serine/threonine phosphatase n=1 Tax=Streptomyces sp. B1I3 TaxID=3042264 RepID=UPI00278077C2|nr:PP2C family protein-serine/threonine phosphatase [Streptomyces sp. B1I3]MDQ0793354.1 serine phosphatase RsbU (regulator of sigma subunit) [Streptomyces sp. B1I3]